MWKLRLRLEDVKGLYLARNAAFRAFKWVGSEKKTKQTRQASEARMTKGRKDCAHDQFYQKLRRKKNRPVKNILFESNGFHCDRVQTHDFGRTFSFTSSLKDLSTITANPLLLKTTQHSSYDTTTNIVSAFSYPPSLRIRWPLHCSCWHHQLKHLLFPFHCNPTGLSVCSPNFVFPSGSE